ncbi:hypothetical protein MAPG_09469 [Magnaporthiopsis poae ATCC 64411]|uniref:Uncharacterized protein n=1 Tax=Magnaporthiopsis poae (strain ATCC 64411 / 73-15) TaxID=644358 RepID=A0A0C4EA15_MAGP6|nr:hypothetical protein MAPG_09469 [Magnaporthiopsis poae ATCC 64411]
MMVYPDELCYYGRFGYDHDLGSVITLDVTRPPSPATIKSNDLDLHYQIAMPRPPLAYHEMPPAVMTGGLPPPPYPPPPWAMSAVPPSIRMPPEPPPPLGSPCSARNVRSRERVGGPRAVREAARANMKARRRELEVTRYELGSDHDRSVVAAAPGNRGLGDNVAQDEIETVGQIKRLASNHCPAKTGTPTGDNEGSSFLTHVDWAYPEDADDGGSVHDNAPRTAASIAPSSPSDEKMNTRKSRKSPSSPLARSGTLLVFSEDPETGVEVAHYRHAGSSSFRSKYSVKARKRVSYTEQHHPTVPPPSSAVVTVVPPSDSGYYSLIGQKSSPSEHPRSTAPPGNLDTVAERIVDHSDLELDDNDHSVEAIVDDSDRGTTYSTPGSSADERVKIWISAVADDLLCSLLSGKDAIGNESMQRVFLALPQLLETFALAIGHGPKPGIYRDIMYLLHRYRKEIADSVKERHARGLEEQHPGPDSETESEHKEVNQKKRIEWWLKSVSQADGNPLEVEGRKENGHEDESETEVQKKDEDEDGPPELARYRTIAFQEPAYQRLIDSMKREVVLAPAQGSLDMARQIYSEIDKALSGGKGSSVSRGRPSQSSEAVFDVDWNPWAFVDEQGYEEEASEAIAAALTLTGSEVDAEALPTSEYLRRTWPGMGLPVLELIQEIVKHKDSEERRRTLPDGASISMHGSPNSGFKARIHGPADAVAQIGQVLSWLGAALRSPPREGLFFCTPSVNTITASRKPREGKDQDPAKHSPDAHFKISYRLWSSVKKPELNGQCWHNLLREAVLVPGFPILCRREPRLGLEIPLDMAAFLTGTRMVEIFDSKIFIKGFSAMLVPTDRRGDVVVWHLLYTTTGTHISYLDVPIGQRHTTDVGMSDLEQARHIVGWCPEATYHVGAPTENYAIKASGLDRAPAGCRLQKAGIHGGQYLVGAFEFAVSEKQKSVHMERAGDYVEKLEIIAGEYVVLWDKDLEKGWLVNGVNALLHLLRASLYYNRTGRFKSVYVFKHHGWDRFDELGESYGPDSAFDVLVDPQNRKLPLRNGEESLKDETDEVHASAPGGRPRGARTGPTLQDRVEDLWGRLEKLIAHQADVEETSGVLVKLPQPRRQLEGWDFIDVARGQNPTRPLVANLPAVGRGWVDLTRSIGAVTLFGRSFGELIRPRQSPSSPRCPRWSVLPNRRALLAVSVSDLRHIINRHGDESAEPPRLCRRRDVDWHCPDTSFSPCPCTAAAVATGTEQVPSSSFAAVAGLSCHDPVQVLFRGRRNRTNRWPYAELPGGGAVVFGLNMNIPRNHENDGGLKEGKPTLPAGEEQPPPQDKSDGVADDGLGSSLRPGRGGSNPVSVSSASGDGSGTSGVQASHRQASNTQTDITQTDITQTDITQTDMTQTDNANDNARPNSSRKTTQTSDREATSGGPQGSGDAGSSQGFVPQESDGRVDSGKGKKKGRGWSGWFSKAKDKMKLWRQNNRSVASNYI